MISSIGFSDLELFEEKLQLEKAEGTEIQIFNFGKFQNRFMIKAALFKTESGCCVYYLPSLYFYDYIMTYPHHTDYEEKMKIKRFNEKYKRFKRLGDYRIVHQLLYTYDLFVHKLTS